MEADCRLPGGKPRGRDFVGAAALDLDKGGEAVGGAGATNSEWGRRELGLLDGRQFWALGEQAECYSEE
jgi:hypothetical protein